MSPLFGLKKGMGSGAKEEARGEARVRKGRTVCAPGGGAILCPEITGLVATLNAAVAAKGIFQDIP